MSDYASQSKTLIRDMVKHGVSNASNAPTFIYDFSRKIIWWANGAAIELLGPWDKSSDPLDGLANTWLDMTQNQLQVISKRLADLEVITDEVTFYPKGQPQTISCTISKIQVENDRVAMLIQAEKADDSQGGLVKSNTQYRDLYSQLFTTNQSALLVIDPDDQLIIDANQAAAHFYGYDRDLLISKKLCQLRYLSVNEKQADLQKIPEDQQSILYLKHQLENGELRDVEVRCDTIKTNEKKLLLLNIHDVSERKTIEPELTESEIRNRYIIDNTPAGFWFIDKDKKTQRVNAALCHMLGYLSEEMLGKTPVEFVDEENAAILKYQMGRITKVNQRNYDIELKHKDGYNIPTHFNATTIHSKDGQLIGSFAFVTDLTELRQAQESRKESDELLRTAFEYAFNGIALVSTDGHFYRVNKAFRRMLKYSEDELLSKTIVDITHPYDLHKAINQFNDLHSGKQKHLRLEVKYLRKDGSILWSSVSAAPVLNHQGEVLYSIAQIEDISEHKIAEEALKESSQRYQAVLESTKDGFLVSDSSGGIVEVNDTYCVMSGYNRDELVRLTLDDLESNQSIEHLNPIISTVFQQGGAQFESIHRRKDGTLWPVEISMSYSPVQDGRFFIFIRDIRERKLSENLIQFRQKLSEIVYEGDEQDLLRLALDEAERLTQSRVGFFHFIERDQQTISLQTWSTGSTSDRRFADGKGMQYPISEAGVWLDAINKKIPVIDNDFTRLAQSDGMPGSFPALNRLLTIPVIRDEQLVAIAGVGNKARDYDMQDITMVARLADTTFDYIERKRAEQQIKFMAYNDVLTGLPNRQLLIDRLNQAILHSRRSKRLLAVCYMDLDGFKPVNDSYGHQAGDQLLIELSGRLLGELRESDTLARLGGDEFIILLTEVTTIHSGEMIVQRILDSINHPFDIEGYRVHVSASIGVTFFPQDDEDPDTLIRHADQAMYKAKTTGKNSFTLYDPIEDYKVHAYRRAIKEFEQAIQLQQLILYYQPRVDLRTGQLASVEALIRWNHPEQGLLTPDRFLPLIANTPQEFVLDEWVIRNALDQHMRWREMGVNYPVSVNISPRYIQQRSFTTYLKKVLADYPSDIASRLEIEVLETSAIGDTGRVSDVMNACTDLGVHFSLDDFGTGYSSLAYFHRLPISVLKIDQHFVRNMLDDVRDLKIVEGVLNLAETLKQPVVAEGVETIELGMMLYLLGCQYAQGYGIGKPMPPDQLINWSDQWQEKAIWHHFNQYTGSMHQNYDLDVSIYTHQHWRDCLVRYVESGLKEKMPELNEDNCQFGRWYRGIGQTKYGHQRDYAFISDKHGEIHRLADDLITLAEEGKLEKAINGLGILNRHVDEMIVMLKRLASS